MDNVREVTIPGVDGERDRTYQTKLMAPADAVHFAFVVVRQLAGTMKGASEGDILKKLMGNFEEVRKAMANSNTNKDNGENKVTIDAYAASIGFITEILSNVNPDTMKYLTTKALDTCYYEGTNKLTDKLFAHKHFAFDAYFCDYLPISLWAIMEQLKVFFTGKGVHVWKSIVLGASISQKIGGMFTSSVDQSKQTFAPGQKLQDPLEN